MLFTQPIFIVFFAIVFTAYWLVPSNRVRKIGLLVASYIFYGAWDWRFLGLIFVSTCIDYLVGYKLKNIEAPRRRTSWLWLSICANLGILGFFKYYNFFVESGTNILGIENSLTLEIVLPVGISFFTFQSMSYTIDIYRHKLQPIKNFTDFALYVSFFPQLVAGPIVRAIDFLPQLADKKSIHDVSFKSLTFLFLVGFIKKTCIADNAAILIDPVFANPSQYDAPSILMADMFYAVQIYCDFSGYSDMAIACAGMLGYTLTVNFKFPYLAHNIAEFWRRWHISLSSWLRDYLYIPLGGNKKGELFRYRNLMITMLLGGLWHGAAWTFVVWGALHGFALAAHRILIYERFKIPEPVAVVGGTILTFAWACIAWLYFRANSVQDGWMMTKAVLLWISPGNETLNLNLFAWFIPAGLIHYLFMKKDIIMAVRKVPDWAFSLGLGLATAVALWFVPTDAQPFIYFQF
jgi:alginate O-acetyltransferase complex protein AlgI